MKKIFFCVLFCVLYKYLNIYEIFFCKNISSECLNILGLNNIIYEFTEIRLGLKNDNIKYLDPVTLAVWYNNDGNIYNIIQNFEKWEYVDISFKPHILYGGKYLNEEVWMSCEMYDAFININNKKIEFKILIIYNNKFYWEYHDLWPILLNSSKLNFFFDTKYVNITSGEVTNINNNLEDLIDCYNTKILNRKKYFIYSSNKDFGQLLLLKTK